MSESVIKKYSSAGSSPYRTRGSSATRELACAGAIGWRGSRIDENSPEALLGTAAGEAVETMATGGSPDLDAVAKKHGVDRDSLGMAYAGGVTAWKEISPWFPDPESQHPVSGETTKGTADLVSAVYVSDLTTELATLAVLDFKLGMSGDQHAPQLMAYALGLVDKYGFPESGYVLGVEVHLMPARYFVHRFVEEQLEGFRLRLKLQHAQAGKQFSPGDECKFCPRNHDCPARSQWMREAAQSIALVTDNQGALADRELLGALWDRSKQLTRALDAYGKAVRVALQAGPIDLPDGRELVIEESETDVVDAAAAMGPVIEFGLDPSTVYKCSKSGIKAAIKQLAEVAKASGERLNQAALNRTVLGHIDAAGGLSKKTRQTIKAVAK